MSLTAFNPWRGILIWHSCAANEERAASDEDYDGQSGC